MSQPIPVNIDRIRAGQVVRVDGRRYFVVTRFQMTEEARLTDLGPEATEPITVEIQLVRASWLNVDPSHRHPDAPSPPESPAELKTEEVRSGWPFVIDGCAYQATTLGCEHDGTSSLLADCTFITLRLFRVWWNDPKEPA